MSEGFLSAEIKGSTIQRLRGALANGSMSISEFEAAVELVLGTSRESDLTELVRRYAPPVRITPPERRYTEPVVNCTTGPFSDIRLRGNWQVPRELRVQTGPSKIVLDFTEAEFDDWNVDVSAQTGLGDVVVIVPRGMALQLVGVTGPGSSKLDPALPGYPMIRLSVVIGFGRFRLKHPRESRREKKARKRSE